MQPRFVQEFRGKAEHFLWGDSLKERPWWVRTGIRSLQILYAVLRDLTEGSLSLRAMSLVYYTVIAFVPLIALSFSVLKGLGALNDLEPLLLGLLQPFLGEYSMEITDNIVTFVDNVRIDVLSVVSLGVLLYTVLTMMQRIELSFNYIWSVPQPRSLAHRVSEYLFAIIVSPLLILLSIGIASYVNTVVFVRVLEGWTVGAVILQFVGAVMPFVIMSLAFALAFHFIPNTRVHFRSAFIGGVVTTIAWKTMGFIFQNFITVYSANAVIYAAFFAVILLMLFTYLGWLMLLIGSSVAFYHQYPTKALAGREPPQLSLRMQEEIQLTIAYLIVKRFQKGMPPWSTEELQAYTGMRPAMIESALRVLMAINFIRATEDDPRCYLPLAAVENCRFFDIRQRLRAHAKDHPDTRHSCDEQQQVRKMLDDAEELWASDDGNKTFTSLISSEKND